LRAVASGSTPQLVRAIGRWSMTAMVVNGIIGSAVYGVPPEISRLLGARLFDRVWVEAAAPGKLPAEDVQGASITEGLTPNSPDGSIAHH